MTKRRSPRPAAAAIRAALSDAAPRTGLAAVQAAWGKAVGPQVAEATSPVSERDGEVLIECSDTVWAQELDLMQEQLLERLRTHLGDAAPRALRFRVGDSPS